MNKMVVFPNIKINLGLNILRKRSDGFHDLSSLFYPVSWCDILEFTERTDNELVFENTGIVVDCEPEKNLIVKAFKLLAADYKLPGMTLQLHKIVPFGAGLGAGSSDAAALLRGLNDYFELKLNNTQLISYAAKLGSDCAFFIENRPCMASGRGEVLTPSSLQLDGWHIIVVKPPFGVSTAEAYANVKPAVPQIDIEKIIQLPVEDWKDKLCNDFEISVFPKYPQLAEIKQQLYNAGAVYAAMSGSGSALFGLFKSEPVTNRLWGDCTVWKGIL
jgi:4-diphosphocytidyl-2-C-methyl-D-erythritol kinase